jgi:hypothetical protein
VAIANLAEGAYELQFAGLGGLPFTPLMWYTQTLGSSGVGTAWTHCPDTTVDEILGTASQLSGAEAAAEYRRIEERNAERLCLIPAVERVELRGQWADRVGGLIGFVPFSQYIWVKTAAQAQ